MKIEMYYLTLRQRCQFQSWSRKKQYLFSHAYIMSRHVPCMALQLTWKHLVYKQLNWRIHEENLSQAVNNGSWYKLSLLVSEDAMIVPATCIYSVWRFAQNSWDMSPWYKYYYFLSHKLGVGKVINRLNLSCTPLAMILCKIFRYFVPIMKLVLRRFLVLL